MTNPFDILPPNIFNLFATQGQSTLQRHYIAILLRIYALAEFNRSGITREVAFAEIVDYLKEANAEAEVAADMSRITPRMSLIRFRRQIKNPSRIPQASSSANSRKQAGSNVNSTPTIPKRSYCPIMLLRCSKPCEPFRNKSRANLQDSYTPRIG